MSTRVSNEEKKKPSPEIKGRNEEKTGIGKETGGQIRSLRDRITQEKQTKNRSDRKENLRLFSQRSSEEQKGYITRVCRDIGMTRQEIDSVAPRIEDDQERAKYFQSIQEQYGPDLQMYSKRDKALQDLFTDPSKAKILGDMLDESQRELVRTHGLAETVKALNEEQSQILRETFGEDFARIQTDFIHAFTQQDPDRRLEDLPRFVMQDASKGRVDMERMPGRLRSEILTFQADERSLRDLSERLNDGQSITEDDRRHIQYLSGKYGTVKGRELLNCMNENLGETLRLHLLPLTYDRSEIRAQEQREQDSGGEPARQYFENLGSDIPRRAGGTEGFSPSKYPASGSVDTRAYSGNIQGIPRGITPKEIQSEIHGVRGTGYYPPPEGGYASEAEARMEGGGKDRIGNPLRTLQDYLEGRADYVSVAMDPSIANGTMFTSRELNEYFQSQYPNRIPIKLMMCDTGSAFKRAGWSRIDICCADKQQSLESYINGSHTLTPIDASST